MINIFEIPKNASRYANLFKFSSRCNQDIEVVFLRDVYARFWSACKTIIPEISLFGDYPAKGDPKRTTYNGMNIDVGTEINKCIVMLGQSNLEAHLQTQSSFIGNLKFDEVVILDSNFVQNMQSIVSKYNVTLIPNFTLNLILNDSPKELDSQAIQYIQNTPNVKQTLDQFYANDFSLLSNPTSLLKATT